jgi:uncharacterized protein (UPF0276 family)
VGLRHPHFAHILEHGAGVGWFEIISENYIDNYGHSRYVLDQIREQCDCDAWRIDVDRQL